MPEEADRSLRERLLEYVISEITHELPKEVRVLLWREGAVTIAYNGTPLPIESIQPCGTPAEGVSHPALYRHFMYLLAGHPSGMSVFGAVLNALSERLVVSTIHNGHRYRAVHARVVEAIETMYGDRLGEHIEHLAHHAVRGELGEKAAQYLREAGHKAAARSALSDAQVRFEQALVVLETLPENPFVLERAFDIRLELRPVLMQLGEPRKMLERLREAEILAERLNDNRRHCLVCAQIGNTQALLGEPEEALASGTRTMEIAERVGDLELRILAGSVLLLTLTYRGEYERVVTLGTGNLAELPADRIYANFGMGTPPSVWNRCWLTMSLAELGRFGESAEPGAEVIRLAATTQNAYTVGLANWSQGEVYLLKGEWAKARSLIEHATAVLRSGNVAIILSASLASSAEVLAQLGEAGEALGRKRECEHLIEHHTATGYVGTLGWLYRRLGRAALVLDRLDEARRLGDLAVQASLRQPGYAAHAQHLLGDVATRPDSFDAEQGETHYRHALVLAEERGMRPLVAHCHLSLSKLHRRTANPEQAHEHLTIAMTMFREMGMTYWLEQAEAEPRRLD
jgi:tetratricopeptide (TPR) repeat protein